MDKDSLAHTTWDCKYHIVFAPKFRRKAIYGKYRADIGKILRELCTWKEVEIIEAHACIDHIHMYVKIPPKLSVSSFMGFLNLYARSNPRTLSRPYRQAPEPGI